MLDYILAFVLITSPNLKLTEKDYADFAHVHPQAQAIALQLEILDRREVKYVLSKPEDFQTDLKLVRSRYEILKDAPPLHDCIRFPSRDLVNEMMSFNRAYRQHIEGLRSLSSPRSYDYEGCTVVLQEIDELYRIWDLVRDALCEYFYITVRRQALMKLKEELGEERFYSAAMPPHVPIWRFSRAD